MAPPPPSPGARGLAPLRCLLRGGLGSFLALALRRRLLLADGLDPPARRPASAIGERFFPRRLVLRLEAVIHELQDGGFRAVPAARAQPENPRVSAGPVHDAGSDLLEYFLDCGSVGDPLRHPPARREAVGFGGRDQALRERPKLLGLRERRLDALVRHQRRELIGET